MTEQPDTAAIRASVDRNQYAEPEDTLALCDALDAAEARIAAAVAELDEAISLGSGAYLRLATRIRRALTGGTE